MFHVGNTTFSLFHFSIPVAFCFVLLCVGFLFLILYPAPPPAPTAASLSDTILSHIIFHTQNFVTPLFVTHQLCHTPLCHTQLCHTPLCHTQPCHTPSLAHNFVTHLFVTQHLSHTTLSHNSSHTTFLNFSILHHLLCLSFLSRPATTFFLLIGRSWLVGLSGPLILFAVFFVCLLDYISFTGDRCWFHSQTKWCFHPTHFLRPSPAACEAHSLAII